VVHRLFWQEQLEQYTPITPRFACTCSRVRTGRMLVTLGRSEVDAILAEQGAVSVTCDFCNTLYSFDAVDLGHLFATGSTDLGRPRSTALNPDQRVESVSNCRESRIRWTRDPHWP